MLQQVAARETVLELPRFAPQEVCGHRPVAQATEDCRDGLQRAHLVPRLPVVGCEEPRVAV